ncbi:hypothetical protein [Geobacillus sp. Y412MC52]|uniref:hypothetical protein n=1 Tax=Geobacillus sp. (strain Y412MC52) TaxID=550542 RepID=UPI0001A22638|nr:hypothetical protein [Geobacillus sp. Y412MC52]
MDYFDSMTALQNLVHEIGHSYYNQKYNSNFFNKSQQVINESLAILTEIIFNVSLLNDETIEQDMKEAFLFHYLHRLNKLITSSFGVFELEHNVIKHIQKNFHLDLDTFLEIRKETKKKLLPNVSFENEENSYLNIFLNPPFIFDSVDEHFFITIISIVRETNRVPLTRYGAVF